MGSLHLKSDREGGETVAVIHLITISLVSHKLISRISIIGWDTSSVGSLHLKSDREGGETVLQLSV